MKELIGRISEARNLTVELEPEVRIKEFLRALTIWPDARGKEFLSFSIVCHNRQWHKQFVPGEADRVAAMPKDELAREIAAWIQSAVETGALSLSNQPANKLPGRHHLSDAAWAQAPPGSITTFVYDSGGLRIGGALRAETK